MNALPTLTQAEATAKGYRPITTGIHPEHEIHILESIELSLRSVNACWIECTDGKLMAGRKATELREVIR